MQYGDALSFFPILLIHESSWDIDLDVLIVEDVFFQERGILLM